MTAAENSGVARCERCGRVIHTGEARIAVCLTTGELEHLALGALDDRRLAERLACAIGLLDPEAESRVRAEIERFFGPDAIVGSPRGAETE